MGQKNFSNCTPRGGQGHRRGGATCPSPATTGDGCELPKGHRGDLEASRNGQKTWEKHGKIHCKWMFEWENHGKIHCKWMFQWENHGKTDYLNCVYSWDSDRYGFPPW